MGCKYACTCAGRCYSCSSYQKEEYFGHAEDLFAQSHGYRDSAEWEEDEQRQKNEYEQYCAEQYQEYCKEQEALHNKESDSTCAQQATIQNGK